MVTFLVTSLHPLKRVIYTLKIKLVLEIFNKLVND